jgi:hypothetical protein
MTKPLTDTQRAAAAALYAPEENMTPADPNGLDAILPAVAKAMGSVKRIVKEGWNEHDKYKFASTDDFLAALNPICAEAGLVVWINEDGSEELTRKGKYGDTFWLRYNFSVKLYHASGQSLPAVHRTVEVVRSGAQASGSAQSYVLKQFLRSLLLVPTGDKEDADYQATGDGPVSRGNGRARADAPVSDPPPDPAITADDYRVLRARIEAQGEAAEQVERYLLTRYAVPSLAVITPANLADANALLDKRQQKVAA